MPKFRITTYELVVNATSVVIEARDLTHARERADLTLYSAEESDTITSEEIAPEDAPALDSVTIEEVDE